MIPHSKETIVFVKVLASQKLDGLFLTGDISTASQIEAHLQLFEDLYQSPVYFVLGNHDYYGGSIEAVRKMTLLGSLIHKYATGFLKEVR